MELPQAVELLGWCEKILGLLGVRPHNPINTRCIPIISFFIIHVSLQCADLIEFLNNLHHVVDNLTQNIAFALITFKLISLRWRNQELRKVVDAIKEDLHANYRNPEELKIVLAQYKTARRFVGIIGSFVFFVGNYMYLEPLLDILMNVYKNKTVELKLPYHVRLFWDVTTVPAYTLTYLFQLPCDFIAVIGYTSSLFLLVISILHICGQLSVLVGRINNLSTLDQKCGPAIKEVVKMHMRLISMTEILGRTYSLVLLAEVLGTMVLICILPYNLLVNLKEGHDFLSAKFLYCLNYLISTTVVLFAYCYIGERLIKESTRVHRAFSECGWEDMPVRHAKSIIICIARSQQPLGLSAGKFMEFSLSSFTNVMKSAMAYFSVLKSLL